jgi:DNA-binding MarR family transcriptional regulator
MSSPGPPERQRFIIEVVDRADRMLREEMARAAAAGGHPEIRPAHNSVFGYLRDRPMRVSELASLAGMTKQSMGELVRDLIGSGILETTPDPSDRRAKLVWYTTRGLTAAAAGFRHLQEIEQELRTVLGEERSATMIQALTDLSTHLAEVLAASARDAS